MTPVAVLVLGALALWCWKRKKAAEDPNPVDPEPDTPTPAAGTTPGNPITVDMLTAGFVGYLQIGEGPANYLSAIAAKANLANWRLIRDNPENAWAKEATPSSHWEVYGLELVPRWGKTKGVDCTEPGWQAALHSYNTGQFPVLKIGG